MDERRPLSSRRRLAPALEAAGFGLVLLLSAAAFGRKGIVQPFPFNHRIHADNGITCDACHEQVLQGQHAGIPRAELCLSCHAEDIVTNQKAIPYIDLVRRHAQEKTEVGWQRIYTLPNHVYFSHRRHAGIAELPCENCHGDIGKSETPPQAPIRTTLDMNHCIDCHRARGVQNDCAWCHR